MMTVMHFVNTRGAVTRPKGRTLYWKIQLPSVKRGSIGRGMTSGLGSFGSRSSASSLGSSELSLGTSPEESVGCSSSSEDEGTSSVHWSLAIREKRRAQLHWHRHLPLHLSSRPFPIGAGLGGPNTGLCHDLGIIRGNPLSGERSVGGAARGRENLAALSAVNSLPSIPTTEGDSLAGEPPAPPGSAPGTSHQLWQCTTTRWTHHWSRNRFGGSRLLRIGEPLHYHITWAK
ncbi:uncharacterized protein LOC128322985 isoform X1 [Hemicordylus capensis]|uniref:uncharacterized protein LOC128322985 isoform X1 n=1 Tax=Hemicordylus capensis TaxID=884348 RepID=UPI002304B9D8|nr:uncharacterized protein LOC128322985 isoform X1 [Hemicordylus capensis]